MMSRLTGVLAGVLLAALCACVAPGAAHASGQFGVSSFAFSATDAAGEPYTQAGGHPYEVTSAIQLNAQEDEVTHEQIPIEDVKSLFVSAPPGLVGDPGATPRCSLAVFDRVGPQCPGATQIGTFLITLTSFGGTAALEGGVYNLVPEAGQPAEFGITTPFGISYLLTANVDTAGGYNIVVGEEGIPIAGLTSITVKFWGVPADPRHNEQRGRVCYYLLPYCYYPNFPEYIYPPERLPSTPESSLWPESSGGAPLVPFLTMPTDCSAGALTATATATSWENPGAAPVSRQATLPGLTGCDLLAFNPSITAAPDTAHADTPAGLTVDVKVPQEGLLNPEGRAPSDLQNTTVTLPAGVVINPGQAAGLLACQSSEDGVGTEGPPSCPNASKVGTVQIKTPLLEADEEKELEGDVYLLQSNPPNLQLLLAASLSADGVNLKLIGDVHLDEATGRLTSTFSGTPQLPFTDLKLSFSGGPQAALATPSTCGVYTTTADFTPWGAPETPDALSASSFGIDSGPGGSACASPLPFSPELIAGATTDQAGGYTDFSMLLRRGDGQQRIDGLRFVAPEGLTGFLSKVPLCTNAQAEANACPEASKIGHTVIESGPGPYPLVVPEAGQEPAPIYLTEAYDGAPFGLSIVVPLHVGPFVLPTQRVRARIEINPYTSQLTVTTNELPQVVAGVPTDLREVDAVIERPEFMVNPTNCDAQAVSGTAYGTPPPGVAGANTEAAISSHFQVGACQALKFEPKFTVSTSGKTSKADGASLTTKVSYPSVPQGADADISYVKIELPKQLPSRLTTLQKACIAAQFESNPAGCPSESKIGYATVHTPLLPVPLTGPVIFVSHGGEAFPSLTVVLQGDGVTIDLIGTTFISKAGITSTTFKTIPDDPFSTFELTLPEGPYSALAANGDLCTSTLKMPTAFVGQNGAEIHQSTPVEVEGCPGSLSVVSSKVKKRTLTLSVYAPGTGKVTASGKGVSSGSKSYSGRETLTFTLKQKKAGKLHTKIKLTFTPSKGKKQAKSLSVKFKK